jgi:hypothetical protein
MRSESGCYGGAQGSARKPEATSSALEILAERFARGEIDRTEFEEKRQVLTGLWKETHSTAENRKGCC